MRNGTQAVTFAGDIYRVPVTPGETSQATLARDTLRMAGSPASPSVLGLYCEDGRELAAGAELPYDGELTLRAKLAH